MQFRVSVCDFLRRCQVERQLSDHTVRAYANDLADFRKFLVADAAVGRDFGPNPLALSRRHARPPQALDRHRAPALCLPARLLPPARRARRLRRPLRRAEAATAAPQAAAAHAVAPGNFLAHGLAHALRRRARNRRRRARPRGRPDGGDRRPRRRICRLAIEDVSPDGASARVHGKGSRDRVVYVSDAPLRRALRALIEERRREGRAHGPLFLNRHGAPLKPQSIRSRLRRYARQIGLSRRVTPHMLRHTAATLLIETGVDIRFVQRLLGHSSIATTEIYTHVSDEALRITLERANILGSLARRAPAVP